MVTVMWLLLQSFSLLTGVGQWPALRPFTKTIQFPDAASAAVVLPLMNARGDPLYTLSCYGAKASANSDDAFIYDGDFECRLVDASGKSSYSTLLTENPKQSRDWESRARFFAAELRGICGSVPEFGRHRTFLLRGFQLTLTITEPRFSHASQLESLTLTVSVQNDLRAAAQDEIATAPLISQRWAHGPCKLDGSVAPHFTSG